jgi:hypothetical protein
LTIAHFGLAVLLLGAPSTPAPAPPRTPSGGVAAGAPGNVRTVVGGGGTVSSPTPAATVAVAAGTATAREGERVSRQAPQEPSGNRPLWYDLALSAITAFAGAGAAAGIVFLLQLREDRRKREEDEARRQQERRDEEARQQREYREAEALQRQERRQTEVRELRRVQFALSLRAATLGDLWNQWLEPALKAAGGHWAPLQTPAGLVPPEPLSLERVEFLLETDANLFSRLHQADRRFHSFIETANRYGKWREEASVRIEERSPKAAGFTTEQVEHLAGDRLNYQLRALARELFDKCLFVRADVMKVFEELGEHIVKEYGGKKLRVEFERELGGGDAPSGGETPSPS